MAGGDEQIEAQPEVNNEVPPVDVTLDEIDAIEHFSLSYFSQHDRRATRRAICLADLMRKMLTDEIMPQITAMHTKITAIESSCVSQAEYHIIQQKVEQVFSGVVTNDEMTKLKSDMDEFRDKLVPALEFETFKQSVSGFETRLNARAKKTGDMLTKIMSGDYDFAHEVTAELENHMSAINGLGESVSTTQALQTRVDTLEQTVTSLVNFDTQLGEVKDEQARIARENTESAQRMYTMVEDMAKQVADLKATVQNGAVRAQSMPILSHGLTGTSNTVSQTAIDAVRTQLLPIIHPPPAQITMPQSNTQLPRPSPPNGSQTGAAGANAPASSPSLSQGQIIVNPCRTSPLYTQPHVVDLDKPLSHRVGDRSIPTHFVLKYLPPPTTFHGTDRRKPGVRSFREWLCKFERYAALQQIQLHECALVLFSHLEGDALTFVHSLDPSLQEDYYVLVGKLLDYYDAHSDDRAKRKAIDAIYMTYSDTFESFVSQLRYAVYELHGHDNSQLVEEIIRNRILFKATKPIQVFLTQEEAQQNRTLSIDEMVSRVRSFESVQHTREELYGNGNRAQTQPQHNAKVFSQRSAESNMRTNAPTPSVEPPQAAALPQALAPPPVTRSTTNVSQRREKKVLCSNCGRWGSHTTEQCYKNLSPEQRRAAQEQQRRNNPNAQPNSRPRTTNMLTTQNLDTVMGHLTTTFMLGSEVQVSVNSTPQNTRFKSNYPTYELSELRKHHPTHALTQRLYRDLPITMVSLDNHKVSGFLDTGATGSVISETVLQKILKGKSPEWIAGRVLNVNCHLKGYGEQIPAIQVTEIIMLDLTLGENQGRVFFMVDSTSTSDMVLIGWPSLCQLLGNIFPSDIEFTSATNNAPYLSEVNSKHTQQHDIQMNTVPVSCIVVETATILPETSRIIKCQVEMIKLTRAKALICTDSTLLMESEIAGRQLGPTLVLSDTTGQLQVVVDNPSPVTIRIQANTVLGRLEECDQVSPSQLQNQTKTDTQTDQPPNTERHHVSCELGLDQQATASAAHHILPVELLGPMDTVARPDGNTNYHHRNSAKYTQGAELQSPLHNDDVEVIFTHSDQPKFGPTKLLTLSVEAEANSDQERRQTLMTQLEGNVPSTLGTELTNRLNEFLVENHDVFSLSETDIGDCRLFPHDIETGDSRPYRRPCRRIPFSVRPAVDKILDGYLETGIIRPSCSPYASPIVLIKKKSGDIRICVDYRDLNKVTMKNAWPIARCDDLFDSLGSIKAKHFSGLDLRSGYLQLQVSEKDRYKTAFVCHRGLFEYCRLPFGLCNAPSTFSRMMTHILSLLPDWARDKTWYYMDDILTATDTIEEHVRVLGELFIVLRQFGLRLNPQKSEFFRSEILYLGFVLTGQGLKVHESKTAAVREFPVPHGVKSLRRFLGLAGYLRRFIRDFSGMSKPMFLLLKKDKQFVWSDECQISFDKLKQAIASTEVLVYPNFELPFVLEVDASYHGFGAMLGQHQKDARCPSPIAFASRTLHAPETNYSATHLEAAGAIWAINQFRPYLIGHKTFVHTDHIALTSVLNCKNPSAKLYRWIVMLQEFDLEFMYKPGVTNKVADALSRQNEPESVGGTPTVASQSVPPISIDLGLAKLCSITDVESVAALQRTDPFLNDVITFVEHSQLPEDRKQAHKVILISASMVIKENHVLYYQGPKDRVERVVVPPGEWRQQLIFESHSSSWAGHMSARRTYAKLAHMYYWNSMLKDVHNFVRACVRCAIRQGQGRRPAPDLQSIQVEPKPFFCVGMDLCKYQTNPNTKCRYALVLQCYFTKWPEVYALQDMRACTVAECWLDFISRHSAPRHVITDQGSQFTSALMQELFKLLQTTHLRTTTFHAQTDGLVERYNRTMQNMLAKTMEMHGKEWDKYLPHILLAYRQMPHSSTNESPFYMLHGYDPVPLSDSVFSQALPSVESDKDNFISNCTARLNEIWSMAHAQIARAQATQRTQYDKKSRPHHFIVGDRVWRFLPGLLSTKNRKTCSPYIGPYVVIRADTNRVEIQAPEHFGADHKLVVSPSQLSPASPMIHNELFWSGRVFRKPQVRTSHASAETPNLHPAAQAVNGGTHVTPIPVDKPQTIRQPAQRRKRNKTALNRAQQSRTAVHSEAPPKVQHTRLCLQCHTRHGLSTPCPDTTVNFIRSLPNITRESNMHPPIIDYELCRCARQAQTVCDKLNVCATSCVAGKQNLHDPQSTCPQSFVLKVKGESVIGGANVSSTLELNSIVMGEFKPYLPKGQIELRCRIINESSLASGYNASIYDPKKPNLLVRQFLRSGEEEVYRSNVRHVRSRLAELSPITNSNMNELFPIRFPVATVLNSVLPAAVIYVDTQESLETACAVFYEGRAMLLNDPPCNVVLVTTAELKDVPELSGEKCFDTSATIVATSLTLHSPCFPPFIINLVGIWREWSESVYSLPKEVLELCKTSVVLCASDASITALGATCGSLLDLNFDDKKWEENETLGVGIKSQALGAPGKCIMLADWETYGESMYGIATEVMHSRAILAPPSDNNTLDTLRHTKLETHKSFSAILQLGAMSSAALTFASYNVLRKLESGGEDSLPNCVLPLGVWSQLTPDDFERFNPHLEKLLHHYKTEVERELNVSVAQFVVHKIPKSGNAESRWHYFHTNHTLNHFGELVTKLGVVLGTLMLMSELCHMYKAGELGAVPGYRMSVQSHNTMHSHAGMCAWFSQAAPIMHAYINVFKTHVNSPDNSGAMDTSSSSPVTQLTTVPPVVPTAATPHKQPRKARWCAHCKSNTHDLNRCFDKRNRGGSRNGRGFGKGRGSKHNGKIASFPRTPNYQLPPEFRTAAQMMSTAIHGFLGMSGVPMEHGRGSREGKSDGPSAAKGDGRAHAYGRGRGSHERGRGGRGGHERGNGHGPPPTSNNTAPPKFGGTN